MVAHHYNNSTQEVEPGESEVQGPPQLHRELEVNLRHKKYCLKMGKQKMNKKGKIFFSGK